MARSPNASTSTTLQAVPSRAASTPTRAWSPMRRVPCSSAICPSASTWNSTASDSTASAPACAGLPNVKVDTGPDTDSSAMAPSKPRPTAARRTTVAVRAMRCVSADAAASAICRTPLAPSPMPAVLRVRSTMDVYTLMRPMPAGPSSKAISLVRTMLTATVSKVAPPMSEVDFRMSR